MNKKLSGSSLKQEKGQVIVLFAILLTFLIGITAFTVDVGYLQWQKRNLQNAADASSLAGAREFIDGNINDIYSVVLDYVIEHGLESGDIDNVNYDIVPWPHVTVELDINRDVFFARVMDFEDADIGARATAVVWPLSVGEGLIPVAFKEEVYLAAEPGDEGLDFIAFHTMGSGNWGTLSFEGTGTGQTPPKIAEYIRDGFPGTVTIADPDVFSAPGAAGSGAQPTVNNALRSRIGEISYVPIVREEVSGSEWVEVVGFAAVIFTYVTPHPAAAGVEVKGTFIKTIGVGNIDPSAPDFGLKGIALLE